MATNALNPIPITIDGYQIDASLTETHDREADVTSYPVEQGVDVADNVRALPIEIEIEGIVSDSPIGSVAQNRDPNSTPSKDALAKLDAIWEAREPITIATSLKRYANMVMTSLSIPRDKDSGRALKFKAHFKQVIIVTNQRGALRTSRPQGQPKQNLGPKPTKNGTDNRIDVFSVSSTAPDYLVWPTYVRTDVVDGITFRRYATFLGSPPPDGWVDTAGYHSLFSIELANYNSATGLWTNNRGEVTKIVPAVPGSGINPQAQDSALGFPWNQTFGNNVFGSGGNGGGGS
jgi:hypothetical protein